ncbi:hypothetical protein BH10ACI1_BH10ACI1_09750 [soil metagenome]
MDNSEIIEETGAIAKLPLLAAVVALIGLADAVYLTIHHYTAEVVPCGEGFDCAAVLTSPYATIGGVPLAVFGAIAYFTAFSLAILATFGNRQTWRIFGAQVVLMAFFTGWLLYAQAFILKAFCQYCLLSAGVTFTLLIIALISKFWRAR